ncbi:MULTISPECIES: hypothetical protein [unclassified Ensifer]|uniref:hypothetical protein n=1 Tax=unclassified Ensifer TaxID=2633371 RepID=UPI000AD593B6|nr:MULTISPECIES: hypothetical protein [unclassified Ensifer]
MMGEGMTTGLMRRIKGSGNAPHRHGVGGQRVESYLTSYLDHYKSAIEPGFAVLVTGPWGSGKTHQVTSALLPEEYYYLSLFGLQSADEIRAAVFAAMYPTKDRLKKIAAFGDGINISTGGFGTVGTKGLPSAIVGALVGNNVETDRVIIFDDLERCKLPINDVLGVINRYVEHHNCRVVVIAHDDEVAGLGPIKEKVFGQTIRVSVQIESAFDAFARRHDLEVDALFLAQHRSEIIGIFKSSGCASLRNLRHTLDDLCRLRATLRAEHLNNITAMADLVRLFTALSLEVRMGNVTQAEIKDRSGARMRDPVARVNRRGNEEVERSSFGKAQDRYPAFDLSGTLLKDGVLDDILFAGRFDEEAIKSSLDCDPHFASLGNVPAWRMFMDFESLPEDRARAAQDSMLEEFESRKIEKHGDLLHHFALRFMMAEHGLISDSRAEVLAQCKSYVDDLEGQGRIEEIESVWYGRPAGRREAAEGIGFWVEDAYRAEFQEIDAYVHEARRRALKSTFPQKGAELMALLSARTTAFFERACHSNAGSDPLAALPVLAAIDPVAFIDAWMLAPAENWYWISGALVNRYKSMSLSDTLSEELPWIARVLELLQEREEAAQSGILRLRIQRIRARDEIPPIIEDALEMRREAVARASRLPSPKAAPEKALGSSQGGRRSR